MSLSVWRVKGGVYTALTAALVPALADIVQRGRPVEVPPTALPRRVYIGDVVNDVPQPVWDPGAQMRLEEYVIPLLIDVIDLSGNLATGHNDCEASLAAIVAGIELALANDPSWGATCHHSGLSLAAETTTAYGDVPGGSGWRSGAILELHVRRSDR
jgi:hypothetical protein